MAIDKKFEDYQPVSFSNKKVQWCKLQTPDEYKGKKSWTLQLIYDMTDPQDKAEADLLLASGFNIREKNGVTFLAVKKDADKNPDCPHCVGPDGKTPFTDEIGNGSVVNVNASAKKWDVCDTITLYIEGVQVVEHVAYAKGAGFGDVTGGNNF